MSSSSEHRAAGLLRACLASLVLAIPSCGGIGLETPEETELSVENREAVGTAVGQAARMAAALQEVAANQLLPLAPPSLLPPPGVDRVIFTAMQCDDTRTGDKRNPDCNFNFSPPRCPVGQGTPIPVITSGGIVYQGSGTEGEFEFVTCPLDNLSPASAPAPPAKETFALETTATYTLSGSKLDLGFNTINFDRIARFDDVNDLTQKNQAILRDPRPAGTFSCTDFQGANEACTANGVFTATSDGQTYAAVNVVTSGSRAAGYSVAGNAVSPNNSTIAFASTTPIELECAFECDPCPNLPIPRTKDWSIFRA